MLRSKAPDYRAAFAIGLGLAGDRGAAPAILRELEETRIDSAAGHFAVGLALMRADEACSRIKAMAAGSRHRPERLRELSIALGILGDRQVVPLLLELLAAARTTTVRAAVAQALGRIGDARCVEPLIAQVHNPRATALARSSAIVALGLVGDPDALPWREPLSRDVNYRAGSATLNGFGGVLDIL
jgi:HEAT repeat protein